MSIGTLFSLSRARTRFSCRDQRVVSNSQRAVGRLSFAELRRENVGRIPDSEGGVVGRFEDRVTARIVYSRRRESGQIALYVRVQPLCAPARLPERRKFTVSPSTPSPSRSRSLSLLLALSYKRRKYACVASRRERCESREHERRRRSHFAALYIISPAMVFGR